VIAGNGSSQVGNLAFDQFAPSPTSKPFLTGTKTGDGNGRFDDLREPG
jgi:hypothetical protein